MEDYEIMRQVLELSLTVSEGLEHICLRFEEGHYAGTLPLFQDIMQAFISLLKAVDPLLKKLPPNQLEPLSEDVQNALELMGMIYKANSWGMAGDTMQHKVIFAFNNWKMELERCLSSSIAS